jgi:DNA-binding MarR family transcriptional regulator
MSREMIAFEKYVPIRLTVLAYRLTRLVARVYTPKFGLTAPEWRTLAVLGRYGAMPLSGVIEHTGMDKTRVSRTVGLLLKGGYVTRQSDAADRRRGVLNLTVLGWSTYRQIVPLALAVEAETVACFSDTERALFGRLLEKLESRTADLLAEKTAQEAPPTVVPGTSAARRGKPQAQASGGPPLVRRRSAGQRS